MSGKLDRSLDEIMKDAPKSAAGGKRGRGRLPGRKAATKAKAATTAVIAPTGGIQKKTKAAKPARAPTGPIIGDSKISVSNLPEDVTEALIKDYFGSTVAPVKKVMLNYGPSGRSRGSCTVTFAKAGAAAEAVKLDGTPVDGRPMRIEVLVDAKSINPPKVPKPLAERVSQPKNAAKEKPKATKGQAVANGAAKTEKAGKKKAKSGRAGRPKTKTAEELDAEMQDYFGGGENGTSGAAAPAAATNGGDTGMDEVM